MTSDKKGMIDRAFDYVKDKLDISTKQDIIDIYKEHYERYGKYPVRQELRDMGATDAKIRKHFGDLQSLREYMDKKHNIENSSNGITKDTLIKVYLDIMKENLRTPAVSDFIRAGFNNGNIRHHFGNITSMHDYMAENHGEEMSEIVISDSGIFSKRSAKDINDIISNTKRFIITTAVSGKAIDTKFLSSIRSYCEKKDAKLIIIPSADVANRVGVCSASNNWFFPPDVKEDIFIFEDTRLNSNLLLSAIRTSAKQIKPTTGLARLTHNNGSIILASPKQFLEYVPNNYSNIPNALMTTGAITVPEYNNDRYMSERTSYLAEVDHVMGAIVVEIKDSEIFFFRQLQADSNGAFIDLGIQYNSDGTTEEISADVVMGDWHSGETADNSYGFIEEITKEVKVDNIIIHDIFNGSSVNHHIEKQPLLQAKEFEGGRSLILDELQDCALDIKYMQDYVKGNVVIVKSNHDEWLERYLMECRFAKDPANLRIALDLANALMDDKDPFEYGICKYSDVFDKDRVIFLQRNESYMKGGVELGNHADIGVNGARASAASMEYAFGNCVGAHSHSALIFRSYFRVGTSTKLRLSYNKGGASTWTNSHALVYSNGARQIITMIDDDWKI